MPKTLVECFDENKQNELKKRLQKMTNIQEITDIIHGELAFYAAIDGEYINNLPLSQVETALGVLAILREFNDIFGAISFKKVHEDRSNSQQSSRLSSDDNFYPSRRTDTPGDLLIKFKQLWRCIVDILNTPIHFDKKSDSKPTDTHWDQIELTVDVDKLIGELVKLLDKTDKLILKKHPVSHPEAEKKNRPQLSDFPEFLKFIQKLAGRRYSGLSYQLDITLQDELPSLLQMYGIKLDDLSVESLTDIESVNAALYQKYDIDTSKKIDHPVIDAPMMLKDDQIVLKGKIRFPYSENK